MSVADAAQGPETANTPNDAELLAKFISIARDRDLSYRARGILLYILANPGQDFTTADIAAAGIEGREAVRRAMEELAALGHYKTTKVRERNGRIRMVTRISTVRGAFDSSPTPSVVYFIERDGFIKIGRTTRLKARLRAISQGGNMPRWMEPGPVNLLATIPGGWKRELELHARFGDARVDGEWFQDCPAIRDFIAQLDTAGGAR